MKPHVSKLTLAAGICLFGASALFHAEYGTFSFDDQIRNLTRALTRNER